MSDSNLALVRLRHQLERIEPRRAALPAGMFAFGHCAVDAALGGGLGRGRLHDLFAEEEDCGSGAGMAALLCLRAGLGSGDGAAGEAASRPFLWLRTEGAQRKAGLLHATGLGELGVDPGAVLLGLVPDEPALLQAAAEATRCAGLGAVLVECWGPMRGLDLTATRRLMLAAEASGVTVLVLRIAGQAQPSAADTRWRVAAAPSTPLEADAPGAPMFDLELLRRRAGAPAGPWRVEWNRDQSCFIEPAETLAGSPLSRPVPALVPGGAAGALRRAG